MECGFTQGIRRDVEIEGRTGFIFTSKYGRPLMPSAVNNVLYNIVAAYNRKEIETARKEKRKEENIVLECCEVSKIKASQIFHKIISTHPLIIHHWFCHVLSCVRNRHKCRDFSGFAMKMFLSHSVLRF